MAGVYKISCLANKHVYLGAAKDISGEWAIHRDMLVRNRHFNKALQLAWNRFGPRHFAFDVLERIDEDDIERRLEAFIGLFRSRGVMLFNVVGDGVVRSYNKDKIGLKISNALKYKALSMSVEERKELWGRGRKGKPLSEEHKKKVVEGMTGKKRSVETKRRMSAAQKESFERDDERKKGVARVGKKNLGRVPVNVVGYEVDGVEYESGSSAMRALNITANDLFRMVRFGRAIRKTGT